MPRIGDNGPVIPSINSDALPTTPAQPVVASSPGELSLRYERDLARLLDLGSGRAVVANAGGGAVSALDLRRGDSGADLLPEAIETGLTTRRGTGPEGKEKIISRAAYARLRTLLDGCSTQTTEALNVDLAGITGPAAQEARAIYVKAVSARCAALSGDGEERTAALATLAAFARRLTGISEPDLLAHSTVLDLDSTRDTQSFDPLVFDHAAGTIHRRVMPKRGDNDGLSQRFTGSCGPTTLQMALCEEDPVRAFIVHDQGIVSANGDDASGDFQRGLLTDFKSTSVSRRAHLNLCRLRNGLGRLRATGRINRSEARTLGAYAEKRGPLTAAARAALEALRALADGFPTGDELAEIRDDPQKGETGLGCDQFKEILDANLGPVTGCRYRQTEPTDGIPPGRIGPYLAGVERALRRGFDVPFGVYEAEHWMLLVAVKGRGAGRQFMVSDPYSARTAWVTQADLIAGRFVADQFDLLEAGKPDYIDTFFLPEGG